ncbi:hypothetical protein IWQ57_005864, partial [Coemansia nantahalensis]
MFRRASESQILQQGRPAQNVHESLERKLSLPIIPNIGKLRANRAHLQPPPLPAVAAQQPMPKRLRTILEDSVGTFTPTSEDAPANVDASVLDPSDEYLVASIGLYLVSARLLVMVCHYEDLPPGAAFPECLPPRPGPLPASSPLLLNAAQCDCASGALPTADAERMQQLLLQIHKLDAVPTPRGFTGLGRRASTQQRADGDGGGGGSGGSGGGGHSTNNLASRHVQIYAVGSEKLLCAFPEDGYQRVHGRPAAVAVASGTGLRSLWEHTGDKTAHPHAMSLLQGPLVPGTGPIRLELRLRPDSRGVSVGTQIILFRWGSLVFVCQQARGDSSTPEHSPAGAAGGEDSALQSYNIATPPRDESARGSMRPDRAVRPVRSANGVAGGWNQ